MSAACIRAQGLVKRFAGATEGPALDNVSLEVKDGQLTALVGPDGAGKTTLMRLIAGLMRPDAGHLDVLGVDVVAHPQAVQDRISYMPQRFGLYEDLSVQENLDLYADLHGVRPEERAMRFERMLAMTELAPFTRRLAGQLSGGMKQKLGLACTLVRPPALLLLDEPTVGVDPLSRRELWRIVEQLVHEEHLSVLVSTAYMDEAERCAHVLMMTQGRLLVRGPPAELRGVAEGRCHRVWPAAGVPPRVLQSQLMDDTSHVVDAVPEAGAVRFILPSADMPMQSVQALVGLTVEPVSERLEDGVMSLLHAHQAEARRTGGRPTETHLVEPQQTTLAKDGKPAPPLSSAEAPVVIAVRDLVRRFGDFTAVASTSFEVRRGEIFGLLGPNGAGKTTTFRMLCGLLPATSGELQVAGYNLMKARASARARVGYVAQKFSLYGQLSVLENLTFFAGAYGLRGERLRERIDAMLEAFDLRAHARERSQDLPGGFKQRLAMAAALLHEPEILFLDEPTSGIDPFARRAFWRRMTALAQQGTTLIVTTHFMEEAEYCDRILIQDAGAMLALGAPGDIRAGAGGVGDMNQAFVRIVEQARARKTQAQPHWKEALA